MKKQRALPLGYRIKNGRIETVRAEAEAVRHIYRLYEEGSSLESIAAAMQQKGVRYSEATTAWNKHMVKRVLENPKYMGTDAFPAILERETYERVRAIYKKKTQAWQAPEPNPEKQIWKRLACGECGGKVKRIGGRGIDNTILECQNCKKRYEYPLNAFKEKLLAALKDALAAPEGTTAYRPTPEILRLENEIDRRISKPTDGDGTRKMVLEAALLRYLAGPAPEKKIIEPDWTVFKDRVDTALICAGEINIRLKQERKWDTDAGIGKECTAHTRQPNAHPHGQAEKRQGAGGGILPGEYGSGRSDQQLPCAAGVL